MNNSSNGDRFYYLSRRLANGEDIVMLGVCVSAELRLHAALVLAAKVMRYVQCSLVYMHIAFPTRRQMTHYIVCTHSHILHRL